VGVRVKWDGIRSLAYAEDRRLTLRSRSGIDITARYPELLPLASMLGDREAILDGEIVAFEPRASRGSSGCSSA
jgi:bifunctional non-homologous end joining protein LigD